MEMFLRTQPPSMIFLRFPTNLALTFSSALTHSVCARIGREWSGKATVSGNLEEAMERTASYQKFGRRKKRES